MIGDHLPVLLVVVPLLAALLAPLLGALAPRAVWAWAVGAAASVALVALAGAARVLADGTQRYHLGGWAPPWGIELVLDPLSAFVAVVVTGVSACALLYAAGLDDARLRGRQGAAPALLLLVLSGLTGMVVAGDLFNLFVFLEVASLASYAVVAAAGGRALLAAFRYVILGSLGASLYLLGVAHLYFLTGTLNMADLADRLPEAAAPRLVATAAALMTVGLGIKMGLFPLHGWLPDVYTHAPAPVAALLAPVAGKVAAYALARVLFSVLGAGFVADRSLLAVALAWLGAVSILAGGVLALRQTDLRRLLAYSSVSQMGYIVLGLGLADATSVAGAYLHVLNHALMKAGLFFVAGAAALRLGGVALADLRTMHRRMPLTTLCLVVAALSMIGVPPAGGFFSKWYLLLGALGQGRWALAAVILLGGFLAAAYMFRILEHACLVPRGGDDHAAAPPREARWAEAGPALLVPMLAVSAGIVAVGLGNAWIVSTVLLPGLAAGGR
jgi:multicomponent Na+:H+ antiporter subunit D